MTTRRNEVWDSDSLRSEHGYKKMYPPPENPSISLDLVAMER